MRTEVINTGSELLLGSVLNTHLRFLATELFTLGLRVQRQVTVPDGPDIRAALTEAFDRSDLVLVTGGLGPTSDDITRDIAAELLGRELKKDPEVMAAIETRFKRRGLEVTDRNARQAMVPEGAIVLPNPNGTAPGLYLPAAGSTPHLFLLPGPPRELQPMFDASVRPVLKTLMGDEEMDLCRTYHIAGMGESQVEELIGSELEARAGLELGYCARPGEVDLRLVGSEQVVAAASVLAVERLGKNIFGLGAESMEQILVQQLTRRGETLSTAESCTGGFIAHRVTNVPGASSVLLAGLVTYANAAKVQVLGVSESAIERHGAVSAEVATAMAEGVRSVTGATHALATTGIAGPGGGTEEKPVGTVYVALASEGQKTETTLHRFPSDRETFKFLASQTALDLLRRRLL